MTDALTTELRKGRRMRWRVTVAAVAVVGALVLAVVGYRLDQARACAVARDTREVQERKDRRLFTELGHDLNATPEQIAAFMAVIEAEYDAMPTPASC